MKKAQKSFRMRFAFWLDDLRQDESELITYIDELKQQRKFVTTIKQGLKLIRDLRTGNTDVLLELFPLVVERLRNQPHNADLMTLITTMMHQQSSFSADRLPFQLPAVPITPAVVKPVDEKEARQRSIQNTLAALEDF